MKDENQKRPRIQRPKPGFAPANRDGNRNNHGEQRPQRPYGNDRPNYSDRPYSPHSSNRSYGHTNQPNYSEQRSYDRPNYGEQRPQRPYGSNNRPNYGEQRPQHPYSPNRSYGHNDRPNYGEQRPNRDSRPFFERQERPRRDSDNYQGEGGGNRFGKPQRRNQEDTYNPDAKYSRKKQIEYRKKLLSDSDEMRLNRYLANAGICSRREADEFIQAGVVRVNGVVVTELGVRVKRSDRVQFHDQTVQSEQKVYILLNKPKNCVTTSDDPQERVTVMDLVKDACSERIYPVGRLDRNTTGVLLLSNDGDLAATLTHPKSKKKKIYHVHLDKPLTRADLEQLATGITLEDGDIKADEISYVKEEDKKQVGIELHSGRNRLVRRMFEFLNYRVEKLDRVFFAGLTKKGLNRGKWRHLSPREVQMLQMGAYE